MKINKCAFIGATPDELDFGYDEDSFGAIRMRAAIAAKLLLLIQDGCTAFISSLEQGVELWTAEACVTIIGLGGKLTLTCVPTGETQTKRWHPQLRDRYYDTLERSSYVIEPRGGPSSEDYILDNADLIVVVGERLGKRANEIIERAKERGIGLCFIGEEDCKA